MYPQTLHPLSTEKLKVFFLHTHIGSLTVEEKAAVAEVIITELHRRDGHISLRIINDTLKELAHQPPHISERDRRAFMKKFVDYFATHFVAEVV